MGRVFVIGTKWMIAHAIVITMKKYLGLTMAAGLAMAPAHAEVKFSERLTRIAEHLGDGGVHFSVTDTKGDLQDVGKLIDRVIGIIPAGEIPPGLRVEALMGDLGLYSLQGRGTSSHQIEGAWQNRSFVLTDGKHEGLLSLLGDESKAPASSSFAPAGADLVLETSLNLREVERTAKKISKAFGRRAEDEVLEGFKEEVLDLGINIADLFADFTVRGTMVLWLDEEKTFELKPGMNLPVPHFAARLENAGMIWKLLESELKEDSNVLEKDGVITLTPEDGAEETPFGPVLPQVVWDSNTKELFMSLTAEDLVLCRGNGARVTTSMSYQKATEGFPEKLSSLAYISSDVFRLVELLTKEFRTEAPPEGQAIITELLPYLEMLGAEGGYAAGMSVEKDGFLAVANLPFPVKGDSFIGVGGVGGIAALAGLATPAISKAKQNAGKAKTTNNLKQLGILLMLYQTDHGDYPKHLGELMTKEFVTRDEWEAMDLESVVYLPNAKPEDRPDQILAYQEIPELDQVVSLRMDLSVKSEPTKVFKKRLREQKKK